VVLSPPEWAITTKITRSNYVLYLDITLITVTIVAYNYYIFKG